MKLETRYVQAKDLDCDSLIYLEDEKRFFWVDDIFDDGIDCTLVFEVDITKNGLQTEEIRIKSNQKVITVVNDLFLSKP